MIGAEFWESGDEMMTENIKELLELAAKACGYAEYGWMGPSFIHIKNNQFVEWNPHIDDGDCFRMETELGISVRWYAEYVVADVSGQPILASEEFSAHNGNENAARCMASLRVAAEIGRRML